MTFTDRAPRDGVTFRTTLRAGIWSVTKNKVFYGDYFSREQAIASACNGARAVEASGAAACVLAGEEIVGHSAVTEPPERTR